MTHIDLLGTPETRRSGLSTRKALKALTSTLIYCWNIIVNNLNEKKTEYIDFEQGSKRRRPLINYFLIIDYLYSRKFPVPKCFFAEKTFANSNSNLKKNAKITKETRINASRKFDSFVTVVYLAKIDAFGIINFHSFTLQMRPVI